MGKFIRRVCLLLVALVLVWGSATAEKTSISWIIRGHLDQGKSYEKAVQLFEEKYPEIDVDLYLMGASSDFDSKVDAMIGAGNIPNVWYPGGGRGPRYYSAEDMLIDLRPYFKSTNFDWNDFFKPLRDFVTINGQVTAVPLGVTLPTLAYNRDLFAQAGLEEPPASWDDQSWTWAKFQQAAQRLTRDINGDGLNDQYGHDSWSPWDQVTPMLFGGDWFDDEGYRTGYPKRSRAADKETVRALRFLYDAIHTSRVIPTSGDVTRLGGSLFTNGKAGMFYGNNWRFSTWAQSDINWGLAAVPRPDPGSDPKAIAFPDAYAMMKGQENPDAAWKLIDFLVSDVGAETTFPALLSPRPRLSQRDIWIDYATSHFGLRSRDVESYLDSVNYIRMSPSFSIIGWADYQAQIRPSVQKILEGEVAPEGELQDLQRRLDGLIAEKYAN